MGDGSFGKGWSGQFARDLGNKVIRYRGWITVVTLLVAGLSGYGLTRLAVSDDYRMWFDKDSADLKSFETLESTYSKSDSILFVVAPHDGNVFTRKTLEDIQWLTTESWKIPFSSRVDSVTNFQRTHAKGDNLEVRDLVRKPKELSSLDLKKIREFALNEPALVRNLISNSGHAAGVNVMINLAGKSPTETSDVAEYARKLKKQLLARDPGLEVRLTGVLMTNAADSELSSADMATLIPVMYVVLLVGLGLMLRTVAGVFASLLTLTLAIAGSMGIAGWLGFQITPISAAAPSIIMTLAVSDCIHFLVTFLQQMRKGHEKREAILTAFSYNLYPSALTSMANMVGYASMNFRESPPFRQFGTIVAVGSVAELFLAFLFIPALLLWLPIRIRATANAGEDRPSRLEEGFATFVIRQLFRLISELEGITLFFGVFISKNHLNENWITWYSPRTEIRRDTDFAAKNLTGVFDLQYSLNAGEAGGIYRPEFLKQVESFVTWSRAQPEVVSVGAITDDIKRVNQSMHGDKPRWYTLPTDRKVAAQYFLLYDMSLPFGMSLTNQVNRDKSATRVMVRLKNVTTNEILEIDQRAHRWMKDHTPLLANPRTYSSSMTLLFAFITDRMLKGIVSSCTMGFIVITLLLMLLFRSAKAGFISLIPNLIPAVITFGLWGLFNGRVGFAVSIVCSTTLGIVVDSTIHFLSHYLDARRRLDHSPEQSIFHAFARAGTAILITDTILVIGFVVLMLSPYALNSVMGEMTAINVFFDVVVTLLLSAPLILLVDRGRGNGGSFLDRLIGEKSVMKRISRKVLRKTGTGVSVLLLCLPLLTTSRTAEGLDSAQKKGLAIAIKADKHKRGYHDYRADAKMTLKDAAGGTTENRLTITFLDVPNDADKELATFQSPGDVKGTSLLTFSHRNGEDDQWLYLPALTRVKRISSSNKSGAFMGSEFAYEDLSYEAIEKYSYKFLRQEKCDLGQCELVDEVPNYEHSGYSHLVAWYDSKEARMVRIDFFDRNNTLQKTYKATGYKKYLGHWWRAAKMEMVNSQTGNSTILEWSNIKFHVGLTARDFDMSSLQRVR